MATTATVTAAESSVHVVGMHNDRGDTSPWICSRWCSHHHRYDHIDD